jgi:2,3-bisphosphoglycerate-dependent phosphoglycerate mutase
VTTVVLIRHGRTAANTAGILVGRTSGVELDEVGREQAAAVGQRLAAVPLQAIVTSPLRRCRQTAQAVLSANQGAPVVTVEQGLVECGYGEWTGKSVRELSKERLWQSVQHQPSAVRFPGGESMSEMSGRAVSAIRSWDRQLAADRGEDAVWAAVSHGDLIKAILADALGMHLDSFQRILVDPAAVSVVRYTPLRPYVITVNSSGSDLSGLFQAPSQSPRQRRRPVRKPAVDGGLGASDVLG